MAARWIGITRTLALGAFTACSASTTTTTPDCGRASIAIISADVLATSPRAECLDGDWTAWPGDLTQPVPVRLLDRGRSDFRWRVGDGAPLSRIPVATDLRAIGQLRGVLNLEGAPCALGDAGAMRDDLIVYYARCTSTLTELAGEIARLWSATPSLAGGSATLCIHVVGERGPRCEASDPTCGPLPLHASVDAGPPPDEPRRCPWLSTDFDQGACTSDGECVLGGCGNVCAQWSIVPVDSVCLGVAGRWCGCVAGRCSFFNEY
jgi:hypothetical protein